MPLASVFVQILQGRTTDREALRRLHERWLEELAPGADGWLGTTGGVTDDGDFILLVRFASAEGARRNSQREEQGRWWRELQAVVDGEVTVHDCEDVAEIAAGGSDEAGFVQVFQGRAAHIRDVLGRLAETAEETLPHRPQLIGAYVAAHGEGDGFTEVLYYPSQEAAQEAVAADAREEQLTSVAEVAGVVTDLRQLDLREPWLHSA